MTKQQQIIRMVVSKHIRQLEDEIAHYEHLIGTNPHDGELNYRRKQHIEQCHEDIALCEDWMNMMHPADSAGQQRELPSSEESLMGHFKPDAA